MDRSIKFGLLAGILVLAACGDVPPTFKEPAEELARIKDAGDLECERLRPDYWFCQNQAGFAHMYTAEAPGVAEPMVARVMLEGDSDLDAEIAELYGFSADDLASIETGGKPLTRGGFTLLMDPTWQQPVIRGSTGKNDASQDAGQGNGQGNGQGADES